MSPSTRRYLAGAILTILFYSALFLIASTPPSEVPYHCAARDTC